MVKKHTISCTVLDKENRKGELFMVLFSLPPTSRKLILGTGCKEECSVPPKLCHPRLCRGDYLS